MQFSEDQEPDRRLEKITDGADVASRAAVPDHESFHGRFALPRSTGRLMAILEIFLVSGLFTDAIAVLLATLITGVETGDIMSSTEALFVYLISSAVIILFLVAIFQTIHRHDPDLKICFAPSRNIAKHILWAVFSVPVFFLLMVGLSAVFQVVFPGSVPEKNPVLELIQTPAHLVLFFISSVFAGGLREEVQRVFVINRSAAYFWSPYVGLIAWSLFFGVQHYSQGVAAIFITALLGLGFGLLYIKRNNVLTPFLSHALFNCTVLVFHWMGRS